MASKSLAARPRQVENAQKSPPPLSIRGYHCGCKFRDRFHVMPVAEQHKIIRRLTIASMIALAKKRGRPAPIFFDAEARPCEGGGYELVEGSMLPITQEEIDAL
jgi:hypothetical protein